MRSGPLPFFQADQIVTSKLVSSKEKLVYNSFLNHKMFLKTEKQNLYEDYFVLFLYNRFRSCNFVCVALEYCTQLLKWATLRYNYVAIRNSCAYLFLLLYKQVVKMGKLMVLTQTNMIYSMQGFFYCGFLFVCKTIQNLKAAWTINCIYFDFNVRL